MYIELTDRRINSAGIFLVLVLLAAALMIAVVPVMAKDPDKKGNDLPKGKCYKFNIIGVPNQMNENFDGGVGKRIFVLRDGSTFFYVYGGDNYEIKDRDGTDGYVGTGRGEANCGIEFPYDSGTGEWGVEIYVRLLGPKDSSIKWKSYYWDGDEYIKFYDQTWNREAPPKFRLRTNALLIDDYQDILWEMCEKNNFRILQVCVFIT